MPDWRVRTQGGAGALPQTPRGLCPIGANLTPPLRGHGVVRFSESMTRSSSSPPPLSPLFFGRWDDVVATISKDIDLAATARECEAFQRKRKVQSAEDLLCLAMIWGPGRQSYRETAALAACGGIVDMSDKAIEGRMRKAGKWLETILARLLAARMGQPVPEGELSISATDGSVICSPGKGGDWRVHARYDANLGRFSDFELTTAKKAECASRTPARERQITIMDRGYAKVRSFKAVLADGGDFIARIGWRQLVLLDAKGQRIDTMALLRATTDKPTEHSVWIKGIGQPLRFIIQPLPPGIAARQRVKRVRKASKKSQKLDPRTSEAAGYSMLLTSLTADVYTKEQVVARYPDRWQVEIGFKRMKTLGGIDELPASDPDLAKTWLLAHLMAVVLIEDLAREILDFPP